MKEEQFSLLQKHKEQGNIDLKNKLLRKYNLVLIKIKCEQIILKSLIFSQLFFNKSIVILTTSHNRVNN